MFSATFPTNVQRLATSLVIGGGGGEGLYGRRAPVGGGNGVGGSATVGGGIGVYSDDGSVGGRGSSGDASSFAAPAPAPPPARVAVGRVGSTVAGIEQRIIPAENLRERKLELLVAVLRAVPDSRTLVFCSGKGTAKWVRAQLQRLLARVSSSTSFVIPPDLRLN